MSSFAAGICYVLCALTSLACTLLLVRGYMRSKVRLLLWSSLFFVALTIDNALLIVDLKLYPQYDLSIWRHGATLSGIVLLLFGLIWDSE